MRFPFTSVAALRREACLILAAATVVIAAGPAAAGQWSGWYSLSNYRGAYLYVRYKHSGSGSSVQFRCENRTGHRIDCRYRDVEARCNNARWIRISVGETLSNVQSGSVKHNIPWNGVCRNDGGLASVRLSTFGY